MNEKGGALANVLLFATLLLLLALPVLQLASASYRASIDEQVKTQAFYLAEAGREHGRKMALDTLQELAQQPSWDPMSVVSPMPFIVVPAQLLPAGSYQTKAWLTHLNAAEYEVVVNATGISHSATHLAQTLTERISVSIRPGPAGETALDAVLFSHGSILVDGSGSIIGNTVTNTTANNSVNMGDSGSINGNLLVGPDADLTKVIKVSGGRGQKDAITGTTGVLSTARVYPQVIMPAVPTDLPPRAAFTAGWWPEGPHRISEDGYYSEIMVLDKLYIDVGTGERRIRVGRLALLDNGKLVLEGSGKLTLFVEDEIIITGSSALNASSHHERVFVYYYGMQDVELAGNVEMHGSIQALRANIDIGGSGKLNGHIITNGGRVNVLGHGAAVVSLLYAPNADVAIGGSGSVRGAIVSKSCTVTGGGARAIFDISVNEIYREIVGASGSTVSVGPSTWSPR